MHTSDLDAELRSFGLHSETCCHQCAEAAHEERERRAQAEESSKGAAPHIREALLAQHDRTIAEHERGADTHARRAAWADEGFLIDGPDERTDAEYARRFGPLQAACHTAGRVRHVQLYPVDDDEA